MPDLARERTQHALETVQSIVSSLKPAEGRAARKLIEQAVAILAFNGRWRFIPWLKQGADLGDSGSAKKIVHSHLGDWLTTYAKYPNWESAENGGSAHDRFVTEEMLEYMGAVKLWAKVLLPREPPNMQATEEASQPGDTDA